MSRTRHAAIGALQAPAPGWLQVSVALNGTEVARYAFRIEGP